MEKSKYFPSKRSLEDPTEDRAAKIVSQYKRSKLQRQLNEGREEEINQVPLCAICLDSCRNQCSPNGCHHTFCFPCISEWGKVTPVCPLCKIEFQTVINSRGAVLGSFEKKILRPDDDLILLGYEVGDGNNSDVEEGEGEESLQLQDRSHGYQLDGFVVEDDFVEYADY
jgi:hypothetical protein